MANPLASKTKKKQIEVKVVDNIYCNDLEKELAVYYKRGFRLVALAPSSVYMSSGNTVDYIAVLER